MPKVRVDGVELHYEEAGRGSETIVFSHGLLWSGAMFEPQLRALSSRYRCIAWDHRGQGRSDSPDERSHQIESCYHDALRLLDHLGATPCHFVGLSMGGFVGMRVAARHPELLRSLTLMATAADPEPKASAGKYRTLNRVARLFGVGVVAAKVMPIMFGPSFMSDPARASERARWTAELRKNSRSIHRAVTGVIEREGCMDELENIQCPTLILWGEEDAAIARARAEATHAAARGSSFVTIPKAGHTMTIENPEAVNAALSRFIADTLVETRTTTLQRE
jgi:pimeloyl-ACP methyl ester carboxylesterase